MGVIAQYQVSAAAPSTVGGTGITLKYFFSNPPLSLWNVGAPGVSTPQQSSQIGQVPSATNAGGQLQIYTQSGTPSGVNFVVGGTGEGKLLGQRFRVYMSGVAVNASAVGQTVTPIIQLNKGTIASPTYVTLAGNVASGALVNAQPLGFSVAADLLLDPTSGSISGFMKYQFQSTSTGTAQSQAAEAAITQANGLVLANAQGQAGFGLVCGVTASITDATFSASLYEFKIVQD